MSEQRRRGRRQRQEGGFTMIEVLIAATITIIGLVGVFAFLLTTMRGNRDAQQASRASQYAEQIMELVRSQSPTALAAGVSFPPMEMSGIEYRPEVTVSDVEGAANLMRITVVVSYDREGDAESTADDRRATLEMLRSRTETL